MKLGRVRIGNKFVFEDRGGVWIKTAEDRAKCFFGKREEYGTEISIGPDAFAYILYEREYRQAPVQSMNGSGMKVLVVDEEDESVVMEIAEASPSQVSAFVGTENVRIKPPRKRLFQNYMVAETYVVPDENALYVICRKERVIGREEDDERHEDGCECVLCTGKGEEVKDVVEHPTGKGEEVKDAVYSGGVQECPANTAPVAGDGVPSNGSGGQVPEVPAVVSGTEGQPH